MSFATAAQAASVPDARDLDRRRFAYARACEAAGVLPENLVEWISEGAFILSTDEQQMNAPDGSPTLTLRRTLQLAIMQQMVAQGVTPHLAREAAATFTDAEQVKGAGGCLHIYHCATLLLLSATGRSPSGDKQWRSKIVSGFVAEDFLTISTRQTSGATLLYINLTFIEKRVRRRLGVVTRIHRLPRWAQTQRAGEPAMIRLPR